jgi:dolichol-phosphate mannosyltransferase
MMGAGDSPLESPTGSSPVVGGHDNGTRPLLLLSVLLVILGVQLIVLGLLGELLVRIYHESQGKPAYAVRQVFRGPVEE